MNEEIWTKLSPADRLELIKESMLPQDVDVTAEWKNLPETFKMICRGEIPAKLNLVRPVGSIKLEVSLRKDGTYGVSCECNIKSGGLIAFDGMVAGILQVLVHRRDALLEEMNRKHP